MPINRVPKRIWGVVFGTPFWGICDWYLTFSCPEHGPGAAPDRPDSVCLFVCLRFVIRDPFWSRSMDVQLSFQKSVAQKRGPTRHAPPRWTVSVPPCRGRCTLLKWRLRRAPLFGLFGWLGATQLVTCTCGATCPRGFLSSILIIIVLCIIYFTFKVYKL